MIDRAICEAVFREAVIACDPAARVHDALAREPVRGREVIGLAIGKAAIAMARGAGPVTRGLVVAPQGRVTVSRSSVGATSHESVPVATSNGDALPAGWSLLYAAHPMPDETSFAAGAEVIQLVESAAAGDVLLALVSGGASALVEQPRPGLSVDDYRERVREVMASGAPIAELNRVRTELSAIKGGKLAARSKAPIVTLVVSDVIGDDPRVIGSGPTVADPLRPGDRVEVVAPMASFGLAVADALEGRGLAVRRIAEPIADDVVAVARHLAADPDVAATRHLAADPDVAATLRLAADPGTDRTAAEQGAVADRAPAEQAVLVAWGEPTVRVPDVHGIGGRAQQLALELARHLRGTTCSAFVAGSDGRDGPTEAAGAFVDGTTWDALAASAARDARLDPDAALRRCDAGTALAAVGALVVTGPTGINHADVVILG